jgi:predicted ArsR family transcriptional regulator
MKQTNEIKITEQLTRRKWNWIGHTFRKETVIEKEAREWNTKGQRKRGRPKMSWQRTIRGEALATGRYGGKLNN